MKDVADMLSRNIAELTDALRAMESLAPELSRAAGAVGDCLLGGNKLMAFGNGGSAADVADFCTEFACRFLGDRDPFPAIDLTASGATLTATANDYSYEQCFSRQIRAFGKPGDVVVGLSTSGNSANVLRGLRQAREMGLTSISLLGGDGGEAKGLADIELIVPCRVTARIQEAHKLLLHTICQAVEPKLVAHGR